MNVQTTAPRGGAAAMSTREIIERYYEYANGGRWDE